MHSSSWLRLTPTTPRRPVGRRRHVFYQRLRLERLEDRTLLSAPVNPIALTFASNTAAVSGTLSAAQPTVDYAVQLTTGDTVSANVTADLAGSGLNSRLVVLDSSGNVLAANDGLNAEDPSLTFQAAATGTYYFEVDYLPAPNATSNATVPAVGLFNLALSKQSQALLPDLVGASFQIDGSSAVNATWGQTLNIDYRIENRGGADAGPFQVQVSLSATNTFTSANPVLYSFTVDGLAADSSTSGAVAVTLPASPPTTFTVGQQVFVGFRLNATGTVTESNTPNDSGQHQGLDYAAVQTLIPITEAPGSNALVTAHVLPVQALALSTLAAGDVNFYQVSVSQSGALTAQVQGAAGGVRLALYDSAGNLLIQSDGQSGANANPLITQEVSGASPGTTYFLEVQSINGQTGAYQLSVNFQVAVLPGQPLAIGSANAPLVEGDFTGNGILDLVTASYATNSVTMLLGNGDGTFRMGGTYAAGLDPVSIAVVDCNGDGHLDLAVADFLSSSVTILLGNGDGTFRPGGTLAVGPNPGSLVAGDFNGDGHADLAVLSQTSSTVYVELGNGDGTFHLKGIYATGGGPFLVVTADFNGDGRLDLAIADRAINSVAMLFGNADGSFASPIVYSLGQDVFDLAVGDFNQDGHPDLVVAEDVYHKIALLLNNGSGSFQGFVSTRPGVFTQDPANPLPLYAVGSTPDAITVGDFLGNGHLDVAVSNIYDNTVEILLGDGNGRLQLPSDAYSVGGAPFTMVAGDFNRDGVTDLAVLGDVSSAVTILLGGRQQMVPIPGPIQSSYQPIALASADLNGDGILDLVAGSAINPSTFEASVLYGNGDGTFRPVENLPVGGAPATVVLADLNNDGILDLAVSTTNPDTGVSAVTVFLGTGGNAPNGPFAKQGTAYTVGSSPQGLEVADFNDDGLPDLAVACSGSNEVDLLWNSLAHPGQFSPRLAIPLTGGPYGLVTADFNHDGHPDLAVSDYLTSDVAILMGTGLASSPFLAPVRYRVGQAARDLVTGDFTGDHVLDLATLNIAAGNVSILPGNGDGTFGLALTTARFAANPIAFAEGDFNNDGKADLAVTSLGGAGPTNANLVILIGNGHGGFTPSFGSLPPDSYSVDILAGKFTSSSNLDLVVPSFADKEVEVFVGNGDGTFRRQLAFSPVSSSQALVGADWTGSSIPDLAAAQFTTNSITIYLSNGDGTLRTATTLTTGSLPDALLSGDFNGDGFQDLAVANYYDNTVSVFVGNGDGTFQSVGSFATGAGPAALGLADVNGDGIPDLIALNRLSDSVSILLGNGDGTFRPGSTPAVGLDPQALAVGDFGNGETDLAVANSASGTVTILLGDGHGNFRVGQTLSVGTHPSALTAADFTGAGRQDLAVVDGVSGVVQVLLSNGNGTFTKGQTLSASGQPVSILAARLEGDAYDLVVANRYSGTLALFRGNGNGTFQSALSVAAAADVQNVVAGDFNGDGIPDLATASLNALAVNIFLGQGQDSFAPPTIIDPLRAVPLIADFNGDGTPDILVLGGDGFLRVRLGQPGEAGVFAPPVLVNPGTTSRARDVALVHTAQGLEIAALDDSGTSVSFYAYQPGGAFAKTGSLLLPSNRFGVRLAAGDLEGNGLDDLVVADGRNNQVLVYLQQTAGGFGPPTAQSVGSGPSSLALADVNGDGLRDILVTNQTSGDVSVILNQGNGSFAAPLRFRAGTNLYSMDASGSVLADEGTAYLVAAPLEKGKNSLDLVVANPAASSFSVLRGTGDGGFLNPSAASTYLTASPPTLLATGDFNGDGIPDLAVLEAGAGVVAIYLGNGAGGFTLSSTESVGADATGLTVADLNGDGIPDLLVGNNRGDVLILGGKGDGTFQTIQRTARNISLATADLLGNGQTDFIVANEQKNLITVQLGGTGAVTTLFTAADGLEAPSAVAVADLNGDNIPDLIVANSGNNSVLVFLGLGGGSFAPAQVFAVGTTPSGITVAPLQGPNKPLDLVVTNEDSNDLSILFGTGSGSGWTLVPGPRLAAGNGPVDVVTADVNGDGISDLLVSDSQSNSIALLLGVGLGYFKSSGISYPVGPAPGPLFLGSFTYPGSRDLVSINTATDYVTYYPSFGSGSTAGLERYIGGNNPIAAVAGNFTGTGTTDLIIATADGHISLLEGGPLGPILTQSVLVTNIQDISSLAIAGLGSSGISVFVTGANGASVITLTLGENPLASLGTPVVSVGASVSVSTSAVTSFTLPVATTTTAGGGLAATTTGGSSQGTESPSPFTTTVLAGLASGGNGGAGQGAGVTGSVLGQGTTTGGQGGGLDVLIEERPGAVLAGGTTDEEAQLGRGGSDPFANLDLAQSLLEGRRPVANLLPARGAGPGLAPAALLVEDANDGPGPLPAAHPVRIQPWVDFLNGPDSPTKGPSRPQPAPEAAPEPEAHLDSEPPASGAALDAVLGTLSTGRGPAVRWHALLGLLLGAGSLSLVSDREARSRRERFPG